MIIRKIIEAWRRRKDRRFIQEQLEWSKGNSYAWSLDLAGYSFEEIRGMCEALYSRQPHKLRGARAALAVIAEFEGIEI